MKIAQDQRSAVLGQRSPPSTPSRRAGVNRLDKVHAKAIKHQPRIVSGDIGVHDSLSIRESEVTIEFDYAALSAWSECIGLSFLDFSDPTAYELYLASGEFATSFKAAL